MLKQLPPRRSSRAAGKLAGEPGNVLAVAGGVGGQLQERPSTPSPVSVLVATGRLQKGAQLGARGHLGSRAV